MTETHFSQLFLSSKFMVVPSDEVQQVFFSVASSVFQILIAHWWGGSLHDLCIPITIAAISHAAIYLELLCSYKHPVTLIYCVHRT